MSLHSRRSLAALLEFRLAVDSLTARGAVEGGDPAQFEARRGYETRAVKVSLLAGRTEIPNGLALCKIHHAAFDANILGVAPDLHIAIRRDVLDEMDGPMLQHGLKDMHGQPIHVPGSPRLRPNRDYLAERFERLRAA